MDNIRAVAQQKCCKNKWAEKETRQFLQAISLRPSLPT